MDNRAGGLMGRLSFLAAVTVAALAGGTALSPVAIGASDARPTTGTIEICASAANGMAGRAFQFSLNSQAPITVNGGACSGPITSGVGYNLVTEVADSDIVVKNIKANHMVFKNLATRSVTARVKAGSTAENETKVTFINRLADGLGALTVCKVAGDPSLLGKQFSFTENGGAPFTVAAGTFAAPTCDVPRAFPKGAVVEVAELEAIGSAVSAITVSDGRGSDADNDARSVKATVGSGTTRVTFTNMPNHPSPGFLAICKDAMAGDANVTGDFQFTVSAFLETITKTVTVGTCTEPFAVPSGSVSITEVTRNPFYRERDGRAPGRPRGQRRHRAADARRRRTTVGRSRPAHVGPLREHDPRQDEHLPEIDGQ